jgi:hypothetical protein
MFIDMCFRMCRPSVYIYIYVYIYIGSLAFYVDKNIGSLYLSLDRQMTLSLELFLPPGSRLTFSSIYSTFVLFLDIGHFYYI